MSQTVIQIGNSLGVTLPKDFVKKHDLKKGSPISVTSSNGQIVYSPNIPSSTHYETASDREWFKLIQEVEMRYGKALEELAKIQ